MSRKLRVYEELTCDICGASVPEYEGGLNRAGDMYVECYHINYGINLTLTVNGKPAEHLCRDCLKKVLDNL